MIRKSIRNMGMPALALGLFVLLATGCRLERSPIIVENWTTSATPPQICPGDPVLLRWDAGRGLDSRWIVQIASDPDLSGGPLEGAGQRGERTVNPTEDTGFSFSIIGGSFANNRHSVDVLLEGETPLAKHVSFEGVCSGGSTSRMAVNLGALLGQCVEVLQVCNLENPGNVTVSATGGLLSTISAGTCTTELNGIPREYRVSMMPDLSVGMSCGATDISDLPNPIVLTFFLGCNTSLPECMPPGSGGGAEPETLSTPAAGACFDTCDPDDPNSCLPGLLCLPRSEETGEHICYNESICNPITTEEPALTEESGGDQACVCGDGICEQARCNELQQTCPADCGQPEPQQPPPPQPQQPVPVCGDKVCNGDETCWTCSQDCGPC